MGGGQGQDPRSGPRQRWTRGRRGCCPPHRWRPPARTAAPAWETKRSGTPPLPEYTLLQFSEVSLAPEDEGFLGRADLGHVRLEQLLERPVLPQQQARSLLDPQSQRLMVLRPSRDNLPLRHVPAPARVARQQRQGPERQDAGAPGPRARASTSAAYRTFAARRPTRTFRAGRSSVSAFAGQECPSSAAHSLRAGLTAPRGAPSPVTDSRTPTSPPLGRGRFPSQC